MTHKTGIAKIKRLVAKAGPIGFANAGCVQSVDPVGIPTTSESVRDTWDWDPEPQHSEGFYFGVLYK